MSVVDDLRTQIAAGRIIFDNGSAGQAARLCRELLGQNAGTRVTPRLQALALELSRLQPIRISSILRSGSASRHTVGRALDVGNETIAGALLPQVATDARVEALGIDKLIFDASVAGQSNRNRWNYDNGSRHNFNAATLTQHNN